MDTLTSAPTRSSDRVLTDQDVRYLTVQMVNAETERDRQVQLGASNISNPCDNCLAAEFAGHNRSMLFWERPYFGRALGTLSHKGMEERVEIARKLYPGARAEDAVICGIAPGYGPIPGHFDLAPTGAHVLDWKFLKRQSALAMVDFLEIQAGREPIYGRSHKEIEQAGEWVYLELNPKTGPEWVQVTRRVAKTSLSERQYAELLLEVEHTYQHYYGQNVLYQRGIGARRGSVVVISRDGTGFFDNPQYDRYDDPTAVHDINVFSFAYDADYADALLERAGDIFQLVQSGKPVHEFKSATHCKFCKEATQDLNRVPDLDFTDVFGAPIEVPEEVVAQLVA
jgi:hypothetical protein